MATHPRDRDGLSRRSLLQLGLAGLGATALGPIDRVSAAMLAGVPGAQLPFVVVVNLRGGNDGLNTVVPLTLTGYQAERPTLALTEAQCLSLNTGPYATTRYGLHPALDGLAAMWGDGDLAVVQKVGYPDANRSHFESEDIWSYGLRNGFAATGGSHSGWIARYAALDARDALGAVSVGMGRPVSFVGGDTNPLMVRSLRDFQFDIDWAYQRNHALRLELARQILERTPRSGLTETGRTALLQGHQLSDRVQQAVTDYTTAVTWPTTGLAGRMRDIAIMLQAGFGTRIFYTGMGGFDTHGSQGREAGRHATLLTELDDALTAFADDMKAKGMWDLCAIVVISEFGRRVYQNGSGGTDHGAGNCVLLAGGAVRGGMHGPDLTESDFADADLPYEVDFRTVYGALLGDHLTASDLVRVFPEPLEKPGALTLIG